MKDIRDRLTGLVKVAVGAAGFGAEEVIIEHPGTMGLGDYATAVAFKIAKREGNNPREVAEKIMEKIEKDEYVDKVEAAGAGFVNFYLSEKFFRESLIKVLEEGESFGRRESLTGKKVMVEYTDPNPFKEFHIGHLMSNTIGESLARIIEANGAEVKRANYQGDVGIHVAKAIWAAMKGKGDLANGTAYAAGNKAYETEAEAKREIMEINRKIYKKSDEEINRIYDQGREESLERFEKMYKRLGTKFDYYFFESEAAVAGEKTVRENTGKVFEESEGAVVFRGEKRDSVLHTRVFINSEGLPTYEAKELGLAELKREKENCDWWVVVTGNEVNDYFKVVTAAMREVWPELKGKIRHISHGMLRLPSGKMSSRTGEVMTAESLIAQVKERIKEGMAEKAESEEWEKIADGVAVGAIKYSILKQSPGKDIVFDLEKSISFEGDSGPYLQYTNARINSVLEQAEKAGIELEAAGGYFEINGIVRRWHRFPEVVAAALENNAPNYMAAYLHELASEFNGYYAENRIVSQEESAPFRVALAAATGQILKNGLKILGMEAPERM